MPKSYSVTVWITVTAEDVGEAESKVHELLANADQETSDDVDAFEIVSGDTLPCDEDA